MNDPIEVEYGKTSNFVTRENNNKKKDYPMKMKIQFWSLNLGYFSLSSKLKIAYFQFS